MASFNDLVAKAQVTPLRVDTLTVVLENPDEYVCGIIAARGTYTHPQWGSSPLVMFDPEQQATNIGAKRLAAIAKAKELDPKGTYPLSFIGIGSVASRIGDVPAGQFLYIKRVADGFSDEYQRSYANYQMLTNVPGSDELVPVEQAPAAQPRQLTIASALAQDEEPF